ncbi:hypothetical protein EDD39_1083 [Kitasatospora cineracea]|uniref:Uncharacterized protein n=1 Tax=Kitasatospora cineracea TaxID=88074 RepID=A0A8G1XBH5_9ACTN|nr:hypothetical protein EDD39_1083 [Kitasatospora cineracea]
MSIITRGPEKDHDRSAEPVVRGRIVRAIQQVSTADGLSAVVLGALVCGTVGSFTAKEVMLLTAEVSLFVIVGEWWRARRA